jgi:hypothetical protein
MISIRDIYFIRADQMAEDFREGRIDEAIALKNMIAGLILFGLGYQVPISIGFEEIGNSNSKFLLDLLEYIFAAVIVYYGVWLAYQANGKGDGEGFFLRFTALSLPIGIQVTIVFFVLYMVFVSMTGLVQEPPGTLAKVVMLLGYYALGISFQCVFFLRMKYCLSIASGARYAAAHNK